MEKKHFLFIRSFWIGNASDNFVPIQTLPQISVQYVQINQINFTWKLLWRAARRPLFLSILILISIHLLTAIGFTPGGSSTVHIYTQTVHRTTQNQQYIEQPKHFGRVRTVPCLCELYRGICLATEEKARKNISHGSRRVPVGTMETECTERNIHNNKNT